MDRSTMDLSHYVYDPEDQRYDQETATEKTKEERRVSTFRWMVVGMLLLTGVVTVLAYFLLAWEENKNFEAAYGQFGNSLVDAALLQHSTLRNSMDSFAHEITAHAQHNNLTWPYVRLPLFESFALQYFQHCHGEFVALDNIVPHEERENYVNWTSQHYQEWIDESHAIRYGSTDKLNSDTSNYHPYIAQRTKEGKFVPDEVRPYYTVRQTQQSPPPRAYSFVNMNLATLPGTGLLLEGLYALQYETMLTRIKPFTALPADEHEGFHTDSSADNPHSFMFRPVYQEINNPTSKIVGIISTAVAWDASLQNLLPDDVNGILVVVRNSCGQVFTYEVRGRDAIYLGSEDYHSSEYDDLEMATDLSVHTHPNFTTTPGHCLYTMHIYPTDEFRDCYTSAIPGVFAGAVFGTFAVVAVFFFLYDWFMQEQNNKLAIQAVRADRVVTQLFPGDMKDRVLREQSERVRGGDADRGGAPFCPMAQEYLNTTIFFGDLAGFTAWSASRSPEQVFQLLEHLYSDFDKISAKLKIFKVETIGDCYVAATGLPEPQDDHAVRMVRFASTCMQRMDNHTAELSKKLGPDTANLRLRVGLHSGKITGGVLKGDKSRFQLFGDTMNTASRMESNGVPGKIHISLETADLVAQAGKGDWLAQREDKIVAKGKGEMDTFFVCIPEKPVSETAKKLLSLMASSRNISQGSTSSRSLRESARKQVTTCEHQESGPEAPPKLNEVTEC